jgi:hypothetical protein
MVSEEDKVNVGIPLQKHLFTDTGGLFKSVYAGKITAIAGYF